MCWVMFYEVSSRQQMSGKVSSPRRLRQQKNIYTSQIRIYKAFTVQHSKTCFGTFIKKTKKGAVAFWFSIMQPLLITISTSWNTHITNTNGNNNVDVPGIYRYCLPTSRREGPALLTAATKWHLLYVPVWRRSLPESDSARALYPSLRPSNKYNVK